MVHITNHGRERTKERLGISKKAAERNAQKALDKGVTHSQAKGSLKRYIDALYLSYKVANNIRIYNRYTYLFKGTTLITVIELPKKYHALADKLQRENVAQLHPNN